MNILKKINPRITLYLIGLVLGVLIIAALCFFSITRLAGCVLGDAHNYSSCVVQLLAITGGLVIILIAACMAAWKYPFASGMALLIAGGILLVTIFSLTDGSCYLAMVTLFFIDGLVFLSMGSFSQKVRKLA